MRIMWSMYCIEPLGRIYRSTWLGGQVASPRDKKGYPGITINPKLTIFGVANTLTSPRSRSSSNTNGQTGEQWRRIYCNESLGRYI